MPDDGGPAFPVDHATVEQMQYTPTYGLGMSLRDWFAGQALGGLCASDIRVGTVIKTVCEVNAELAYAMADAMLVERGREGAERPKQAERDTVRSTLRETMVVCISPDPDKGALCGDPAAGSMHSGKSPLCKRHMEAAVRGGISVELHGFAALDVGALTPTTETPDA